MKLMRKISAVLLRLLPALSFGRRRILFFSAPIWKLFTMM